MIKLPETRRFYNFDETNFTYIKDLFYFEGPLVVHYMDGDNNNYLYWWYDTDDILNRWYFFAVELEVIKIFKENYDTSVNNPLEDFIKLAISEIVILDINGSNKVESAYNFLKEEINLTLHEDESAN